MTDKGGLPQVSSKPTCTPPVLREAKKHTKRTLNPSGQWHIR